MFSFSSLSKKTVCECYITAISISALNNWLWDTFLRQVCIFSNLWRVVKIWAFIYLPYVYKSWNFRTNTSKGFAVRTPKVAEISKTCFTSPKSLGDGGLNLPHLPHRRVGSTTMIRCVHGAPIYFAPLVFRRNFSKTSKNWTIFWRGIGPWVESRKKWKNGSGFFSS